jgi:hypothetical protein
MNSSNMIEYLVDDLSIRNQEPNLDVVNKNYFHMKSLFFYRGNQNKMSLKSDVFNNKR